MTPTDFLNTFGPSAVACYEQTGLFASTQLAQLIQEVGWNLSTPKDIDTGKESYNLFNIKGSGPAGSVTIWTSEYVSGKWIKIKDQFRAYNSYAEAFADHAELLLTKSWYERVRLATSPKAQCQALYDGGYATDPNYVGALGIISKEKGRTFTTEADAESFCVAQNTFTQASVAPQSDLIDSFHLEEWDAKADFKQVAEASLRRRFGMLKTSHQATLDEPVSKWLTFTVVYRAILFLLRIMGH